MYASSSIASDLVSVIIPCYNHGAYLVEAIESILAQTYPNIEIIVVDDGSTDNTKEVACGFEKVRYIYQTNAGLSAARNTGIKLVDDMAMMELAWYAQQMERIAHGKQPKPDRHPLVGLAQYVYTSAVRGFKTQRVRAS